MTVRSPIDQFKSMYIDGELTLGEFEQRIESALEGDPHEHCAGYGITTLGGPDRCGDCGGAL